MAWGCRSSSSGATAGRWGQGVVTGQLRPKVRKHTSAVSRSRPALLGHTYLIWPNLIFGVWYFHSFCFMLGTCHVLGTVRGNPQGALNTFGGQESEQTTRQCCAVRLWRGGVCWRPRRALTPRAGAFLLSQRQSRLQELSPQGRGRGRLSTEQFTAAEQRGERSGK